MKLSKIATLITAASLSFSAASEVDNNRYIIKVDNNNKKVIKALAQKLGAKINLDGNGFFSASFKGKALSQVKSLLNNTNIQLIEVDQPRYLFSNTTNAKTLATETVYQDDSGDPTLTQVTPYAIYQSQADQVSFNTNAGIKVCIIDSGLDASATDFNWNNISGDNDSGTGNWNENGGPHGTHVAGTIAASNNDIGVVGMAPDVDLHIIKVFNEDGWGYSSDLASAAQLCQDAGANIISMSLGGSGSSTTEEAAFQSFADSGGLAVAAAGNDGNAIRSYPAGYPAVMMVGAVDGDNNIADFSQYPKCSTGFLFNQQENDRVCVEVSAGGVNTLSTYPEDMATLASLSADNVSYESSAMENLGTVSKVSSYYIGTAEAVDSNANGKVCLIDRGNNTFYEKVANCESSGGVGAVIINNVSGVLTATLGTDNDTTIPAIGADFNDKSALLTAASISIDINTSDYGYMSGTSMATPAVSGVAALVWSNHNQCSGEEIRNALIQSALYPGTDGSAHDVYYGYGIIQAANANQYLIDNPCTGSSSL
ncbi:S8 family serine peptidase [uncultured Shewanella sp.]|uniref:S8 family serine peptidase n=1 Tax=uncultured Shewanella sp. TaxID=173975 RepID=UPI002614D7C1|nr:S8 family serine peptidase [uncultured Shewanella sp.]